MSAEMTEKAPVSWKDYYELTKPNVVLLMLLTSVIGMFMAAPGMVPIDVLIFGNLGIALCAGSAAAINHLVDRRIDIIMARTSNRPVATGRLPTLNALVFAGVLGVPTYTVARDLDNPFLHQFINDLREKSGQFILPKAGSSDLVEKALADGHTMTLLGDQYAGDKGCWVEFLGRKASCHKALALFTLTSGAPMVVVSTTRAGGPMQFILRDHGVADPRELEESQQSVKGLTTWYNQRMAEQILKNPEQYWWVHRRWKPKQKRKKAAAAG